MESTDDFNTYWNKWLQQKRVVWTLQRLFKTKSNINMTSELIGVDMLIFKILTWNAFLYVPSHELSSSLSPIFPVVWKSHPKSLKKMWERAPRDHPVASEIKTGGQWDPQRPGNFYSFKAPPRFGKRPKATLFQFFCAPFPSRYTLQIFLLFCALKDLRHSLTARIHDFRCQLSINQDQCNDQTSK